MQAIPMDIFSIHCYDEEKFTRHEVLTSMLLLSTETLDKYLTEICSCNALEIQKDGAKIYIPYMMNDAIECYLVFTNAQLTGQLLSDYKEKLSYELIQSSSEANCKHGIIFRQGTQNVFTLWYSLVYQNLNCYRYDQIGHFWVNGQEHWRRLVYILGTIYDKYEYLGPQVCNQKELTLLNLMEFAPLYAYSPIHEPLDSFYTDTKDGWHAMKELAVEAKDYTFILLLQFYRIFPVAPVRKLLTHSLNHPGRMPLYELLFHKIEEASIVYPKRDYGTERNLQIEAFRKEISIELSKRGYQGTYPLFQKENRQILAMEEHPFTILESDHFKFRIHLMESETKHPSSGLNAGFFRKKGNQSRIISSLNSIHS
jgi:hypothetical protein